MNNYELPSEPDSFIDETSMVYNEGTVSGSSIAFGNSIVYYGATVAIEDCE